MPKMERSVYTGKGLNSDNLSIPSFNSPQSRFLEADTVVINRANGYDSIAARLSRIDSFNVQMIDCHS
jgi:hypothetical protein